MCESESGKQFEMVYESVSVMAWQIQYVLAFETGCALAFDSECLTLLVHHK